MARNIFDKLSGKIKPFHLEDELQSIKFVDGSKPSMRLFKTKKGKRAIAGLIDIEENHNHSWYDEIVQRAKKNPNALALFYRGTKISFEEMIKKADDLAKAMKASGIVQGDNIPAFLSNTPETVYFLLAANKLGAKVNLMSNNFDKDYLNELLDKSSSKMLFITDDQYLNVKSVLDNRSFDKIIMSSLADSLPDDPTKCDEYEPSLDKYYHYDCLRDSFVNDDNRIISFNSYSDYGKSLELDVESVGDLNTEFLHTYTSGSTRVGYPKPLTHTNRSLIVSGRFHDSELSGNPDLAGLRGMAHIHTDSNTDIITCISDNLMQLWSVALEPEYSSETALDAIFMNKPNYLNMTLTHLMYAFKEYLYGSRYVVDGQRRKMPWLFACFAVGEGTSPGEEKFLNKCFRIARAGSGVKINGFSLPFTTLCIGGGDTEHGGIYYTLWKALYDKVNYLRLKNHITGMNPEAYVQISSFKQLDDGSYKECDYNELGVIASNSATTMSHYLDNPKKTEELIITDEHGREWVSNNVLGYVDELGGIHVKGRLDYKLHLSDSIEVYPYVIEDEILRDTKNVLSCTATNTKDGKVVINIQFQPDKKKSDLFVIKSAIDRIYSRYNYDISNLVAFRIIDFYDSFPETKSGKRSVASLEEMGESNTVIYNVFDNKLESNIIQIDKVRTLKQKKSL